MFCNLFIQFIFLLNNSLTANTVGFIDITNEIATIVKNVAYTATSNCILLGYISSYASTDFSIFTINGVAVPIFMNYNGNGMAVPFYFHVKKGDAVKIGSATANCIVSVKAYGMR